MQALLGAGAPTSHVQPINRQHVALDFALDVAPLHIDTRVDELGQGCTRAEAVPSCCWLAVQKKYHNRCMQACLRRQI